MQQVMQMPRWSRGWWLYWSKIWPAYQIVRYRKVHVGSDKVGVELLIEFDAGEWLACWRLLWLGKMLAGLSWASDLVIAAMQFTFQC